MVFQNYALYPHMTVAENIGFALKLRKSLKGRDRRAKVARDRSDPRAHGAGSTASPASSRAVSASASRWAARSSASRACS